MQGTPTSIYFDSATQSTAIVTSAGSISGTFIAPFRTYRWSGTQWLQSFPVWPVQGDIRYTGSQLASGALGFRYVNDTQTGGIIPRTVRLAGGVASEQFLTSYPPEGIYTTVWDPPSSSFYAFGAASPSIWRLTLGPDAQASTLGSGCPGARGTPSLAPQQGSAPRIGTNFVLQSLNLPLSGPVFLALGASDTLYGPTPLPLNLAPLGAPQCNLLVSIDNMFPTTNVLGAASWSFTIPNIPGGIFFTQAIVFDASANAFGITLSNAIRGVVGS